MASIHGHEVLHMMLETKEGFPSIDALVSAIENRFGKDAEFHTCSASGLTAQELAVFLENKGKFIASEQGFNTHEDKICSH